MLRALRIARCPVTLVPRDGTGYSLSSERKSNLAKNRHYHDRYARDERKADYPRLSFLGRIRNGSENRNRYDNERGCDSVYCRVERVGVTEISNQPRGEVERGDVHRENRVGKIVERPAQALPQREPREGLRSPVPIMLVAPPATSAGLLKVEVIDAIVCVGSISARVTHT